MVLRSYTTIGRTNLEASPYPAPVIEVLTWRGDFARSEMMQQDLILRLRASSLQSDDGMEVLQLIIIYYSFNLIHIQHTR